MVWFLLPNGEDEPHDQMARSVRKHDPLELLGICDRQITAERADLTKRAKRVYTVVPPDPQTIGQHIHRKRVDEGLTQKQLASRWGIWRATLGSWEADHYEPEGRKRAKVVAWLGFDPRKRTDRDSTEG